MTTPPSFLATLASHEREELAALFRPVLFAPNEVLFTQGSLSTGAFLIEEGEIDLEMAVPGDETVIIDRVRSGSILGEHALLHSTTRNLTARAVAPVRAQFIDRLDFQGFRYSFRPVSFRLLLEIASLTGRWLQESDQTTLEVVGEAGAASQIQQPLLGETESPGCSFDPRQYLPALSFFEEFGPQDCDELLRMCQVWELPRGRGLIRMGQRSDRCWIVIRGAVEAYNPRSGMHVALFGPGDIFGQLSPLLGSPAIADCRVRERAVVLEVGPVACRSLFAPTSRVSFKFLNATCLALSKALARANRVLARTTKQRMIVEQNIL